MSNSLDEVLGCLRSMHEGNHECKILLKAFRVEKRFET